MGMKEVCYIRNACVIGEFVFFVSNTNSSLNKISIKNLSEVINVADLCKQGDEWTIQKDENILYCISLSIARIVAFDTNTGSQIFLKELKNERPFVDARLIGKDIWFIPWRLCDSFYVYSIDNGKLETYTVSSQIDENKTNEKIYRWNYADNRLLITYKGKDHFYEYSFETRKVKKIVVSDVHSISDVHFIDGHYYIISEPLGRVVKKISAETGVIETISINCEGGYRRILFDGEYIFFDADTGIDYLSRSLQIIATPIKCKHKETGSNFYSVLRLDKGWIFVPWVLNRIVFLPDNMCGFEGFELNLSNTECIRGGRILTENEMSLKDYIDGIIHL